MTQPPCGRMLPVHCCCDPKTRLGWIAVPQWQQRVGERLHFLIRRAGAVRTGFAPLRGEFGMIEHVAAETIETEIGELFEPPKGDALAPSYEWTRTLAVKSNHHPIETWRQVPGFIDDALMMQFREMFATAAVAGGVVEPDPETH